MPEFDNVWAAKGLKYNDSRRSGPWVGRTRVSMLSPILAALVKHLTSWAVPSRLAIEYLGLHRLGVLYNAHPPDKHCSWCRLYLNSSTTNSPSFSTSLSSTYTSIPRQHISKWILLLFFPPKPHIGAGESKMFLPRAIVTPP